jgi:Pectinesterase
MKMNKPSLLLSVAALLIFGSCAKSQDKAGGKEPIVITIDPAALTYDYLVDGNLPQDDPPNKKFKTLQVAYEAAPAGTEQRPTIIGIRPNVYQLPGGDRVPSMEIKKDWITFLGLTNNRRSVVLADNRGLSEGSSDDGFMLMVNCTGFAAKNLTMLNYCNCDYEYPGDPSKNLKMRNPTITQAVALQAEGDKQAYENVALLSRLDTMFLRTKRSYFKNVYIEGTDDFIGGGQVSYWDGCEVVFPTGHGVMSASGIVFANTIFESTQGMQFAKGPGRPVALIHCILPVNTPQNGVAWVRGEAPPRPNLYSLTYQTKDANGKPAVITDSSQGTPTFTYSRELSDQEAAAFNPWNILRAPPTEAADNWDPSHTKDKYEPAGQGSLIYRMALTKATSSIRTGSAGVTIGAAVSPIRAADPTIRWSTPSDLVSLSRITGPDVVVTGKNTTDKPEYVPVTATAANGFYVTAYVFVEPRYTDPPAITAGPKLNPPAGGKIAVDYTLDLRGKDDQSAISWYICDDPSGANPRQVAASRGNLPLKEYILTSGDVGKYIKVGIEPKHQLSDPGKPVFAIDEKPISASDVPSSTVSPNFRNFIVDPNDSYVSGRWTVLGTWTSVTGDRLNSGYGIRVDSQGASLFYQQDADCDDMQIDLVMTPEKTAGSGFGSPGSPVDGDRIQKSDIFIKYDPRTRNGYSLRYWRTTQSTEKCMFQFYKIVNGAGSPISEKQSYTGVFKPTTYLTLKVVGSAISASAHNDVDKEILSLEDTIIPNHFGGAGVFWNGSVPRGNSNVYSLIKISYP